MCSYVLFTIACNDKMDRVSPRINNSSIFQMDAMPCCIFGEAVNYSFTIFVRKTES